ncbi:autotransporter family protein [Fusobacterium ulcerans]|uniref:autotransporter family protein n=1 Tax=Fusobacterium ulcerans TaxID=861 RepID=UPI0026DD3917|nr:autotransporter outer membrane beta-barrel domain-containing protein [Fusobacterium ulcerans]
MLEKIMKEVKRKVKKKSLNITTAAVIGFLLSCPLAMGEGLEITQETGEEILFNEEIYDKATHPFEENTFENNVYTNNMKIEDSGSEGDTGCGLFITLEEDLRLEINNNGLIAGVRKENDTYGYGLWNYTSKIEKINNNGVILGEGKSYGIGIWNHTATINNIENNGIIYGSANNQASGIQNESSGIIGKINNSGKIIGVLSNQARGIFNTGTITDIKNTGIIYGNGNRGLGIWNQGKIENIENKGLIIGIGNSGEAYGIQNNLTSSMLMKNIKNTGKIVGISSNSISAGLSDNNGISSITNPIDNLGMIIGKAKSSGSGIGFYSEASPGDYINNFGILIGGVRGITIDNTGTGTPAIENYGIAFSVTGSNSYTISHRYTGNENITVDMFSKKREMKVKNASTSTSGSESISGNTYENYILNGITDTLKVSGTGNKIKGSVVNAYTSAIKFDNTGDNSLTISGSIINGGLDDDGIAIKGDSKNDELILEAGEIEFKNESVEKINTVINGSINLGEGDNKLTIFEGTVINGEIITGSGNDTLTLGKENLNRSAEQEEINIFNNIKGFDETSIKGNITIFDKTYVFNKDLSVAEEKLTAELGNITLENGSNLILKIDDTQKEGDKITGHALHGNTGSISSNGGKLLLDVGKLSAGTIVNFGGTELTDSMKGNEINYSLDITLDSLSLLHNIEKISNEDIKVTIKGNLPIMPYPDNINYNQLNKIYQGILSTDQVKYFNIVSKENLSTFLGYLNNIYAGNPYSYSSELSRKSAGMFRDIVTENIFRPETNKWMIYGGLTHVDGGTKDTYYGKGYYTYDIGSSDMDVDTKITGAYMLGEYGISDTLTSGVVIGGNKLKSDLSNGSKVDGSALYLGAYAKRYVGNLKVTAGLGFQYGDYNTDRIAVNKVASDLAEPVIKYSDNYNDISYDIYLNGRYSNPIGDNLFLEPYATLSYTYVDQDGANEGSKTLAIETDSKSFDYTVGKVGVDLKKVIPHEKGKSTVSAGVSYTKILDGAEEKYITGKFKNGSNFDILIAHKNKHSIGLNAKYALELKNGVLFDVKGTYSIERDSYNGSGKNRTKGEWIIGTGLGYKF